MVAWTRSAELVLGWESFRVQITQLTKIGFKGINNHLFSQLFRPLKNIFSLFATYSSWFQVKVFLFNATEALSSANRKPFLIYADANFSVSDSLRPYGLQPARFLVHGVLQERLLEWVATPSPGHLFNPRIQPASLMSPALAGRVFTTSATWCYSGIWCFKSWLSFTKINFPLLCHLFYWSKRNTSEWVGKQVYTHKWNGCFIRFSDGTRPQIYSSL